MNNQKLIKQLNKQLRRSSGENGSLYAYIRSQDTESLVIQVEAAARKPFQRLSGLFQFEPTLASWLHSASALGGSIWLKASGQRVEVRVSVPGRGKIDRCFEVDESALSA